LALVMATLWSAPADAAPTSPPIVQTTAGAVAGIGGDIIAFKGIPYAAPPVGPLRWRPPQPPVHWTGVRDAQHFGNDCMQTPYVISTGQQTSEDCLTVNVWTQAHGRPRRPVLVFIYGGAFIGGSGAYPLYDGAQLASAGVVLVSLNYRVGIFGFLAHPALSVESPHHASGNYGLLDQIAALEWVKANIAAFGGDPARVTVFGESAGAFSIAALMSSPLAPGLFTGAILQSPGVPPLAALAAAEHSGAALGSDLAALRALSAEQLLARNGDFFPHSGRALMTFEFPAPIVDGYVLTTQPREAFAKGKVLNVPTLVGTNADEGRMFLGDEFPVSVASYRAWIAEKFGPLAGEVLRLNPAATDAAARAAMAAVIGDGTFGEGARAIARGAAQHQPRTYSYLFTRSFQGRGPPPTHSEELPYVFGSLDRPNFVKHLPPDEADARLSRSVMRAWARFAATGDPNGAGLPRWQQYDPVTDPYLELGSVLRVGRAHRRAELDAIERYYAAAAAR
jgi:carboxylesterase type B